MSKANEPAFPGKNKAVNPADIAKLREMLGVGLFEAKDILSYGPGLTKLELFSAMAMQSVGPFFMNQQVPLDEIDQQAKRCARWSKIYAKALLAELEKEEKE